MIDIPEQDLTAFLHRVGTFIWGTDKITRRQKRFVVFGKLLDAEAAAAYMRVHFMEFDFLGCEPYNPYSHAHLKLFPVHRHHILGGKPELEEPERRRSSVFIQAAGLRPKFVN